MLHSKASMISKKLLLLFFLLPLLVPAETMAEPWQYPNLKTRNPKDLEFGEEEINGSLHKVLRFSNTVYNAGEGPLELRGEEADGINKAYQRVYDQAGNFIDHPVGQFVYHPEHEHWHFEDFAQYELWTKDAYQRWNRRGELSGAVPLKASKATFCVIDIRRVRRVNEGSREPVYISCDPTQQGLSVGWGDTYGSYLFDQWIDLGSTTLPNGEYVLRSIADPVNRLKESANNDPAREGQKDNAQLVRFKVHRGKIRM
jgi:hypothetical protein